MPETSDVKNTKELVRLFPCWAAAKKEKWLSKKAAAGWMFTDAGFKAVYRFKKNEKGKLRFAVEYMGKSPDVPADIADDCNCGWEYIGRFGRYRYYYTEESGEVQPAHPAADNKIEPEYLRGVTTNLITLLLLNAPGTIYCILFVMLFFINGGFAFQELYMTNNGALYFFGAVLGIIAYVVLTRWLVLNSGRIRIITKDRLEKSTK